MGTFYPAFTSLISLYQFFRFLFLSDPILPLFSNISVTPLFRLLVGSFHAISFTIISSKISQLLYLLYLYLILCNLGLTLHLFSSRLRLPLSADIFFLSMLITFDVSFYVRSICQVHTTLFAYP